MTSDYVKAWVALGDKLRFFARYGAGHPCHLKVFTFSNLLKIPESVVRDILIFLARSGFIALRTWSNTLWREADFTEFPTLNDFFYNPDDACHVRIHVVAGF
jgi:hypothetical protein